MRIVFMGTPDLAVDALKALIDAGHDVCAVVTREDKPKGRGYEMVATPVKEEALRHGIEVLQPKKLRDNAEIVGKLKSYDADYFVVIAYGRILPQEVLDIPKKASINIHASLLPSYRGADPIQWAVIDGVKETGVTTMLMDAGLDTGDILRQYRITLNPGETGGTLWDRIAALAGEAIVDTLAALEKGEITPVKQGETDTDYARMLTKADGEIDWNRSSAEIERLVRGLNPWPSAYTHLGGKLLKLWKVRILDEAELAEYTAAAETGKASPLVFRTADGAVAAEELQLEGKRRMTAEEFLRGYKP